MYRNVAKKNLSIFAHQMSERNGEGEGLDEYKGKFRIENTLLFATKKDDERARTESVRTPIENCSYIPKLTIFQAVNKKRQRRVGLRVLQIKHLPHEKSKSKEISRATTFILFNFSSNSIFLEIQTLKRFCPIRTYVKVGLRSHGCQICVRGLEYRLSLIHISEPTRPY